MRQKNTSRLSVLFISLLLCASMRPTAAQSYFPFLSENAVFYLITCGPGNDFYTTFGHSALLVKDIVLIKDAGGTSITDTVDIVFNYGTFDFNTPHFYYNFAKGRLNYCLSISDYTYFIEDYRQEGRSVFLQQLNLSKEERDTLFKKLIINYQPAHRHYAYDLLRDNCATRIRDLLWSLDSSRYLSEPQIKAMTYRQLLHPYMHKKLEWWKLGVDLVLGIPCDRPCCLADNLFLPMELMRETSIPTQQVLEESKAELTDSFPPFPCMMLFFLLFMVISFFEQQNKINKVAKVADLLLFGIIGLLSVVLLFLWFCSNHYCSQWNLNILWINPLFLLLIFCKSQKKLALLRIIHVFLLISLIIYCIRWPQCFPWPAFPILLSLLLRIQMNIRKKKIIIVE